MTGLPAELRARIAADLAPVRPLAAPWRRSVAIVPLALLALVAAPLFFNVRGDVSRLGWFGGWGVSTLQGLAGLLVIGAALREAVPGRAWRGPALGAWLVFPVALMTAVTWASWEASPVLLQRGWWTVGGLCLASSAASALPIVALAGILAARAYPVRPGVVGALAGLGAGLMADAGWRMFCHFSEPAHVLSAHLGGVLVATGVGAILSIRLNPDTTSSQVSG